MTLATITPEHRARNASAQERLFTTYDLKNWFMEDPFRRFRSFDHARYVVHDLGFVPMRFKAALAVQALARRDAWFEDTSGTVREVTLPFVVRCGAFALQDALRRPALVARVRRQLDELTEYLPPGRGLDLERPPLYLRSDLWFGIQAGGSVTHVAGVVNNLEKWSKPPIMITTELVPTVREDIETHVVQPDARFCDYPELARLSFTGQFADGVRRCLGTRIPSFVYQRYSLDNYSGVQAARALEVPFVLEYNGSEVWINRHWGTPLKDERLANRIELLNLRGADLVVVVSDPLSDEVISRGVDPERVLVNPNGVDVDRYRPDVPGDEVRLRYRIERDELVVGFIGTFGRWHGAEVLAEAFVRLVDGLVDGPKIRLLMIGDGETMPEVEHRLDGTTALERTVLTGMIAQAQGPAHLAACDILVAPHVPNPDGTPFFGSPTKLFEYMAMGRPIVASDLDQIGEVLDHEQTALLVPPGDPRELARAIATLLGDADLRVRLGTEARKVAAARFTWRHHTQRIIRKLQEICG